jgi:hypothetical protein
MPTCRQCCVMPPQIFGMVRVQKLVLPGSSRSGE